MPRLARVFIENAYYHIMARGNRKQTIFRNEEDFRHFYWLLHKYKVKYGCLIYGYCLMENHIHLVAGFPNRITAMSHFMHDLNQSYAMKFNGKYRVVGHLWQNRYKAFVVLKDEYLINLICYIEFNPVRAKVVLKPEDYPWSSYQSRLLGERDIILDKIDF